MMSSALSLVALIRANASGTDIGSIFELVDVRSLAVQELRRADEQIMLNDDVQDDEHQLAHTDTSRRTPALACAPPVDIASIADRITPAFTAFPKSALRSLCILDLLNGDDAAAAAAASDTSLAFRFPFSPSPFQRALLAHMRWQRSLVGHKTGLLVLATALGKTIMQAYARAAIAAHMLSISSSTDCPKLPTRSRCMHLGDYKCGEVEGHGRHTSAEGVDGARGECSAQARRRYRYDLVILDDGHQHRKLVRDYNILMINCLDTSIVHWTSRDDADGGVQTRAELRGQLLPLGTLREPLEQGIAKAHLIVLHNCDLLSQAQLSALSHTVTNQWTNSLDRRSTSRAEKRQTVQMSDTAATPPQQPPPLILTYSQVSSIRPLLPFSEHAGGGEGLGAVGSVDWWLPGVSPGSRSMSPNTQKPRSAHCASHTRRAATQAPQVSTFVLLY